MGTQGTGRKRAPVRDRFSAEDEALSSIAREAEARLAAKRAARAEARDIRMRELERQQKELPYHSSSGSGGRKWGQIHQWMADTEKASTTTSSSRYSGYQRRGLDDDLMSVRSYRSTSSSVRDLSSQKRSESRSSSHRKDLLSDSLSTTSGLKSSRSTSSVYSDLQGHRKASSISSSSSRKDLLTGLYHDQRKYSSLTAKSKTPSSISSYQPMTSYQPRASVHDDAGVYGSGYSSKASSDDDSVSTVSQDRYSRGRRDSVSSDFSDISESAADYFSRSNRRGSVVSDLDDLSIPDLDFLDDKCDKTFPDYSRPSSRCATPSLSAATLASLGGTSSRRGSVEAGAVVDPDASMSELRDIYELKDQIQDVEGRYMQGLKELKESLSEVEEKYKKAMVSNAQLDNDKANLIYQVDTLKDVVEEMEEQTSEMKRELEDKSKELERQKHTCNVLQHKQEELKEGIRQRDELIEKHGLVILPEGTPNGDYHHEANHAPGLTLVSQEAAQLLESAGEGPLDVRLRKQAEEKEELLAQIRRLKMQVEDERQKHAKMDGTSTDGERMENGTDLHIIEMQRDANRQVSEYKFKLSKAEQEMGTMEQNVNRLEGQVARYKTSADNSEKVEDELKVEKRKLQRELRTALDKNEEMEMTNSHLVKRLEKMKANRNALLAQQ